MVRNRVKNIPEIIPATPEHIPMIAANVREDDQREFDALGWNITMALRCGLMNSMMAWTGLIDGIPLCMFGVASGSFISGGRPWMIGTKDLDRYASIFLRRCKPQVDAMLELSPMLSNYVHVDNKRAIRWLKWLGFKFGAVPVPYGKKQELFYCFSMKKEVSDV